MKSVLLIGMGKFGRMVGDRLLDLGNEVMIVDKNEDTVNALASRYTNALIANCMNIDNLRSMDIPSFDVCVVAIGDDFQSSLEITSHLKDLGAKRIVSKAATEIQKKFLLRVGADEVIYPDRDTAEKLAIRLNSADIINYIDLGSGYSIFEILCPPQWVGRKLIEVNPRGRYGMNILTVKKEAEYISSIDGNYVFDAGDQLVVFGNGERIISFTNTIKKK